MYSLNEVFEQAIKDDACGGLDSLRDKARLLNGIKITKDNTTEDIIIQNTTLGGDYYREITQVQYQVFKDKGWREGVYNVSLSNYKRKLDNVESRIKDELNGRKNAKTIQLAKSQRQRIMENYSKISTELNFNKNE
tara:strand:+ start:1312 stop:1719 length:408 start_codon:yes stop_codon:yes gene_type:complete